MHNGETADLPLSEKQNAETAFRGVCTDFGFAWQWQILRGDDVVHEGAALSEAAAWRAVKSMIRVFGSLDKNSETNRPQTAV